jgi:multidrug efflux pump subunit AcrA (membrane-fusion protein)
MTMKPTLWIAAAATAAATVPMVVLALHAKAGVHEAHVIRAFVEPVTVLANAGLGGKVMEVNVRSGEAVRKGQLLARFDASQIRERREELTKALESLERAQESGEVLAQAPPRLREFAFEQNSEVVAAESAYVNALEAYEKAPAADQAAEVLQSAGEQRTRVRQKIGRALSRRSTKADLINLAAALRKTISTAEDALRQADVVAPCDATIDILEIKPGDSIPAGAPVALLTVRGEYFSDFAIPKRDGNRMSIGMPLGATGWRVESLATRKVPVPFRDDGQTSEETVVHARLSSATPVPVSSVAEFRVP